MKPQKYKFRLSEKKQEELFEIIDGITYTTNEKTRAEILLEVNNYIIYAANTALKIS